MKIVIKAIPLSQRTKPAKDKYPEATTIEFRDTETQAPLFVQVPTPLDKSLLFKESVYQLSGVVNRNFSWTDKATNQTRTGNLIQADGLTLTKGE